MTNLERNLRASNMRKTRDTPTIQQDITMRGIFQSEGLAF